MVTPVSFGGIVCANAEPAAKLATRPSAAMTAFTVPSLIKNAPLIGVVRQSYHEGNHGDSRAFSLDRTHAMQAPPRRYSAAIA